MPRGPYARLCRLIWLLLALLMTGRAAAAAPTVLVITENGAAHEAVADTLRAALAPSVPPNAVAIRDWRQLAAVNVNASQVVVTIGTLAARAVADTAPARPVLHTLVPRTAFEHLVRPPDADGRVSAIFLDQPAQRQIGLVRAALPAWSHVALLSGGNDSRLPTQLASAARERQLVVTQARVARDSDLYTALQTVLEEPAVLIAVPDTTVFNAYTIQNVLLTAYRRQSPVVGFSPAYVRAGALLALYSTPEQIGRQAAEAVRAVLQGKPLPPPQSPTEFEVGVNAAVARSLGITLEPADVLAARLARQEKTP